MKYLIVDAERMLYTRYRYSEEDVEEYGKDVAGWDEMTLEDKAEHLRYENQGDGHSEDFGDEEMTNHFWANEEGEELDDEETTEEGETK